MLSKYLKLKKKKSILKTWKKLSFRNKGQICINEFIEILMGIEYVRHFVSAA